MAYKVSVSKVKKQKSEKSDPNSSKPKSKQRTALIVVAGVVVILATFLIGKHYGMNSNAASGSDVVNLTYSASSTDNAPTQTSKNTNSTKPPTAEELKAQAKAAASTRAKRVISSSGRVVISGSLESVSDKELSVKTKTGQVFILSVDSDTRVVGSGNSDKTSVSALKTDSQVAVTISVTPEANFKVRTVRVSN